MNEINLLDTYTKTIKLWWVILVATIVGGLAGFLFSRLNAPVYEATAIFPANVDISHLEAISNQADLFQYNEDAAMATVEAALLSPGVKQALLQKCEENGINIDANGLLQNTIIERKHAFWELRYRNTDPGVAEVVTNYWAELGYQQMLDWKQANKVPQYIEYFAPTLATLPSVPVYYGAYQIMIAGSILGVLVGFLLVNLLAAKK